MQTYTISTFGFAPNDELILRSLLLLGGARLDQRWQVDTNAQDPDALFSMPSARDQAEGNTWVKGKFNVLVESKHVPYPKDPGEWLLMYPFRIDALITALNRLGSIADERHRIDRILSGTWLRKL
jgi:hypothetical protein